MKLYTHKCRNCHGTYKSTAHRGDWCNKPECQEARAEHWRDVIRKYHRKRNADAKSNKGKPNTNGVRYCNSCGKVLKNNWFNCKECLSDEENYAPSNDWIFFFNGRARGKISEWPIMICPAETRHERWRSKRA